MEPIFTILAVIIAYLLNTLNILSGCGQVRHRNRIHQDVEAIKRDLRNLEAILKQSDDDQQSLVGMRVASFRAADAIEKFDQLSTEEVELLFDSVCGFFKSMTNLKSHIQIASGIRHAKKMVNNAISDRPRENNQLQRPPNNRTWANLREDALEKDDIVGIEKPSKKLMGWLLPKDPKLRVISVVGMGGMGKTTLVKKVFDDIRLKDRFRHHVWTTISQSLNVEEFLKDIIRQIYAGNYRRPIPGDLGTMEISGLQKMVQDSLRPSSGSYLLVLDDIWSINDCNAIINTLPKGYRSRIILTTRDDDIAPLSCLKFNADKHVMAKLSSENSKELFCRKAFEDGRCPTHLEQTVESILGKCDGLPLAINSIGGFLRKKKKAQEWETANSSLGYELRMNKELDFMKKILSLSYNELSDEVKSCFLYLSMFPEDYKIEYNRLIRLWMAEKFVHPIEEKTVEEVAEEYFKILLNRNLIQAAETSSDGRFKSCRVHDIMHKICILKSKDQRFAGIHNNTGADWPDNVRRLSIQYTTPNVDQITKSPLVRALCVFGLAESTPEATMHALLLKKHRKIKILDLQGAPLKKFPREITKLVYLRYLSLRHTKVEEIPNSISKLKNLETLDLKHARVSKLPTSIVELTKLRVLLVYRYDEVESYTHFHYKYGFEPPDDIGQLKSLRKLSFVDATRGRHILTQLGNLTQLRRLGVTELKEGDGAALCSSINNLSQLRALSITSWDEEQIIDLPADQLRSPQCLPLQRLYLTGSLKELPMWIPNVTSLVRLSLKGSRLDVAPLKQLQDLPRLEHLELFEVYNGKELHFEDGGFMSLKVLGLDKFEELETIKVDKGAMGNLEKLIIQRCMMLKEVPVGIEHLTRIKVLELFDMPQEIIQRLRIGGEDNLKIAHIPQAYSTHWNKGWESNSLDGTLNVRDSITPFGK
ncbi:Disease resistance protein [Corchorus capsularis]|uniref:Disease resistance protein n=1 Tax=Corchorus capsularis TaxID=210143 RepID=A0A1R3JHX8_COCAP|nr:Disease resistance protein [Corchorus capsularis]